jgi:hypothetical protein
MHLTALHLAAVQVREDLGAGPPGSSRGVLGEAQVSLTSLLQDVLSLSGSWEAVPLWTSAAAALAGSGGGQIPVGGIGNGSSQATLSFAASFKQGELTDEVMLRQPGALRVRIDTCTDLPPLPSRELGTCVRVTTAGGSLRRQTSAITGGNASELEWGEVLNFGGATLSDFARGRLRVEVLAQTGGEGNHDGGYGNGYGSGVVVASGSLELASSLFDLEMMTDEVRLSVERLCSSLAPLCACLSVSVPCVCACLSVSLSVRLSLSLSLRAPFCPLCTACSLSLSAAVCVHVTVTMGQCVCV